MDFTIATIRKDLRDLKEKDFLIKYLFRSENWYFGQNKGKSDAEAIGQLEILKEILNRHLGIAFHNVLMVGSGKIGCSLAPHKEFREFDGGETDSDIDIAIVSSKFFDFLWEKIRVEYSIKYIVQYDRITSSIFRGFINEKDFAIIDEVRADWCRRTDNVNRDIQKDLPISHSINYRIYRGWEDLEDYHINGLRKLKQTM